MPARLRPLAALCAVLMVAGCTGPLADQLGASAVPTQAPVAVTGPQGTVPELEYSRPFDVVRPGSRTLRPGTGEVLAEGEDVLLDMYAEDGRDGSVITSTYQDAPSWHTFSAESLGPNVYESLRGKRVGARVLVTDMDDGVPVVLVIDVLPTRADGEDVTIPEDLPQVLRSQDGEPAVVVPDGDPPTELVVQPVVRGDGPQVAVGQVVTARYVAVRWSDGSVVDSSWVHGVAPQSETIGIGRLVEAWDQGLLEQSVGTQVMLVAPPGLAHGGTSSELADDTIVYVVDILDARYQAAEEAPPDESIEGE
ncbi:FKBP-type peptidyl-prolyl cis-trans isomerase [Isoptericola jiangsuensis]|uniref:FKBP-type peptidyl-prolyl cis-trans isomerase n=1 Tax=Isoptericola jiangsuensis TaxID=548579 RepID=UPI003AAC7C60